MSPSEILSDQRRASILLASSLFSRYRESTLHRTRDSPVAVLFVAIRRLMNVMFPQKWERENNSLPASQRRPTPRRPDVAIDHSDWNTAAWEKSQVLSLECYQQLETNRSSFSLLRFINMLFERRERLRRIERFRICTEERAHFSRSNESPR